MTKSSGFMRLACRPAISALTLKKFMACAFLLTLLAASPTLFWLRFQIGKIGLWSRSIPSTADSGLLANHERVFLDALRVKIRDAESRQVKNKAVYVALGVTPEGEREVLGLWIANNEGAKFWLSIMNNLRNRGVTVTRPLQFRPVSCIWCAIP